MSYFAKKMSISGVCKYICGARRHAQGKIKKKTCFPDLFLGNGKRMQMIYESLFNRTYSHISIYIMLS